MTTVLSSARPRPHPHPHPQHPPTKPIAIQSKSRPFVCAGYGEEGREVHLPRGVTPTTRYVFANTYKAALAHLKRRTFIHRIELPTNMRASFKVYGYAFAQNADTLPSDFDSAERTLYALLAASILNVSLWRMHPPNDHEVEWAVLYVQCLPTRDVTLGATQESDERSRRNVDALLRTSTVLEKPFTVMLFGEAVTLDFATHKHSLHIDEANGTIAVVHRLPGTDTYRMRTSDDHALYTMMKRIEALVAQEMCSDAC